MTTFNRASLVYDSGNWHIVPNPWLGGTEFSDLSELERNYLIELRANDVDAVQTIVGAGLITAGGGSTALALVGISVAPAVAVAVAAAGTVILLGDAISELFGGPTISSFLGEEWVALDEWNELVGLLTPAQFDHFLAWGSSSNPNYDPPDFMYWEESPFQDEETGQILLLNGQEYYANPGQQFGYGDSLLNSEILLPSLYGSSRPPCRSRPGITVTLY